MPRIRISRFLPASVFCFMAWSLLAVIPVVAQDWGGDPYTDQPTPYEDDGWQDPQAPLARPAANDPLGPTRTGWSVRGGIGFTAGPESFHLNLEFPYVFDRWVSAGPSFQLGFDDDNTIVAPTLDLNIRLADLESIGFGRVIPFGIMGVGFAVIDEDGRGNDTDAGLLFNFGLGLEYRLNQNVYLGSQMKFNILPTQTLGQTFFYSWQIGGIRYVF